MPALQMLLVLAAAALCASGVVLVVAGLRGRDPAPAERPQRRLAARLSALVAGPWLTARLVAGLALAAVIMVGTRWPVAAVAAAALVVLWPAVFGARRQVRDRNTLLEALVMWTESLRDIVGGANGLIEAIPVSVASAHPILADPLTRLNGRLASRDELDEALSPLAQDLADPGAEVVVAALVLNAKSRGPGLSAALGRLSSSLREELELRQGLEAARRGDRRTVQIIVAMVALMMTFFALLAPPVWRQAYQSATGQVVLLVVFGIFTAAFAWMRRLQDPDIGETFLMDPDNRSFTMPASQRSGRSASRPGVGS